MAVFYRKAFEAACRGKIPPGLTDSHFDSWERLQEALLWLPTDEQRCDAVYGDWLLQLNAPGGTERLAIKNLLIGSGALAANYLAELAQNAHDAADGQEAEIRIVFEGDWLIFSNNGRRVTPLNQIGLCRFFRHFDPAISLKEAIGKFGVGFKSSFRIADEVFIETWERDNKFAFRLPITTAQNKISWPNPTVQQRVIRQLEAVAERINPSLLMPEFSGFCTPEFMARLPDEIPLVAGRLMNNKRGTVFCFHLHEAGKREVGERIRGQIAELYELCPVFLKALRLVQLGSNELRMSVSQLANDDCIPGEVEAERVTLTTTVVSGAKANSRFWRLRGLQVDDKWQVALHCDSDYRLRLEKGEDELNTSMRDGAAYAFFPLNAVTQAWPFRLHLHLDLPTNLARSDWNPNETERIKAQLRKAISGVGSWVAKHSTKCHPNWRIEDLIQREPNPGEIWARQIFDQFLVELNSKQILRTLWGDFVAKKRAKTVRIIDRPAARKRWEDFIQGVSEVRTDFPLVKQRRDLQLGIPELSDAEVKELFRKAAAHSGADDMFYQNLVAALFSIENTSPATLEEISELIPVVRADGTHIKLSDLCCRPMGDELHEEWHKLFRTLAGWIQGAEHQHMALFDKNLLWQLRKLSELVFNPPWESVPSVLSTDNAWQLHGDEFWRLQRDVCPAGIRRTIVECLQVKDESDVWKPITSVWLVDSSPGQCFSGVITKWDRGTQLDWNGQRAVKQKLHDWGLWDAWEDAVELRLQKELSVVLQRKLAAGMEPPPGQFRLQQAFETIFDSAYQSSKQQLGIRWRGLVDEAEQKGVRSAVRRYLPELRNQQLGSGIGNAVKKVLCSWPGYKVAPHWLTTFAAQKIRAAFSDEDFDLFLITGKELNEERQRNLASQALQHFYAWKSLVFTESELKELDGFFNVTPLTLRGNWSIGLMPRTQELLKNFMAPGRPDTSSSAIDQNRVLLALPTIKWHRIQQLPAPLSNIASVAAGCLQTSALEIKCIFSQEPLPISRDYLEAGLLADPTFVSLLTACGERVAGCFGSFDVQWFRAGELVCELRDAPFAVWENYVVTSQIKPQGDNPQFRNVLGQYAQSAAVSAEFTRRLAIVDSGKGSAVQLYQECRKEIVQTLLQREVTQVGYTKQHIVRELLQNAESAYASKSDPLPDTRDFEFILSPLGDGGGWEAKASHAGRTFNEIDKLGNTRDDIGKIVRTASEQPAPSKDEISRFNRGFKSIFTVADSVSVVSGRYKFVIRDMLIIDPPPPVPEQEKFEQRTRFRFECSKSQAYSILKLKTTEGPPRVLSLLNPSSFAFLKRVNSVRISLAASEWTWRITQQMRSDGWSIVDVQQGKSESKEQFLVRFGITPESLQRFAVAIRLHKQGTPTILEPGWKKVRLTFETEDDFPFNFLVNGDFETDTGRLGIRNSPSNLALLTACYRIIVDFCEASLNSNCSLENWIGCATIIRLHDAKSLIQDHYPEYREGLLREVDRAENVFLDRIPHGHGVRSLSDLISPTGLMRRLVDYASRWGFSAEDWIDERVDSHLPSSKKDSSERFSLDDLIGSLSEGSSVLKVIQKDLATAQFIERIARLSAVERQELDRATRLLIQKLRPADVPEMVQEEWTVRDLWTWWDRRHALGSAYKLDQGLFWMLYPGQDVSEDEQKARLKNDLTKPNTATGRAVWYKVFSLACLLGAGRRMQELQRFWREELEQRGFWSLTCEQGFPKATEELFSEIIQRRTVDLQASHEDAHFWRRIFYDVRKLHQLVYENDFAEVVVQLAQDQHNAVGLLHFLRSGTLLNQPAWRGVFGQSAGSPLFFIVRELTRLELVPQNSIEQSAFFVCTPVRRAAVEIGWLDPSWLSRWDFESLHEISRLLYRKIMSDTEYGPRLLPWFDIPLLHRGLEG